MVFRKRIVLILATLPLLSQCAGRSAVYRNPVREVASWWVPVEPVPIAGPIHYVGTKGLGCYLITTREGDILIDGGMPSTAGCIERSIRKAGRDPRNIRKILISHAHVDHVGTIAHFKALSGAEVYAMGADVPALESGGKTCDIIGRLPVARYRPVKVDHPLHHLQTVSLGGITLTAHHTPGHTPGCTTWTTTIKDRGIPRKVVFAGSTTVNPGTKLEGNTCHPSIREDYEKSFGRLAALNSDIFLSAHSVFFGFEKKREALAHGGVNPFVDREGYHRYIADQRCEFLQHLRKRGIDPGASAGSYD